MPPPLRTVATAEAPLLGSPSCFATRSQDWDLFVSMFYYSPGYCMDCIKVLSSQVREGFSACSAFLSYLQTPHPLGMTWDQLGLFGRSGQEVCGIISHLATASWPQPHGTGQLPASALATRSWPLHGASLLLISSPGKPAQEANLTGNYRLF